jgi:hypothetical protein
MGHPLDEAHAKLARARIHLEELDGQVRSFSNLHPYGIAPDRDSEPGVIIMRASALTTEEPVPHEVGVVLGDVLHNLRCALEYLAWQLAGLGKGPDKYTHFPLCETSGQWYEWGRRNVARLRPEHATFIERMQPYNRPRSIPLLNAVRLNNVDKHALVAATGWGARFQPPDITGGVLRMVIKYDEYVPVHDGAPLFRITEFEPAPDQEVQMKMQVPYTVLFGKAPITLRTAMSRWDLVLVERHVRRLLWLFRDEF